MPNVTFKIGMDNRIQPGDTTQAQLMTTLALAGVSANAANVVRDPITGQVVHVEVNLPDTAAAAATAAINANPGVAVATAPIPEPPSLADFGNLDATAGIASAILLTPDASNDTQAFEAALSSPLTSGQRARTGLYIDRGAGEVYEDGTSGVPTTFTHTLIKFLNLKTGVPGTWPNVLTIPAGTPVTLKGQTGVTLPLTISNDIVLTAGAGGLVHGLAEAVYWVAADGKLYLATRRDAVLPEIGGIGRTFDDATTNFPAA